MVGGLLPCSGCARHVRTTERSCPFCGALLALREPIAELRLLTPLDRSRRVALGAVLSAAGIALGCREPVVAVYGAPPTPPVSASAVPSGPPAPLEPTPSAEPLPRPPEAEPAPSSSVLMPAPKPTVVKPPPRDPDPRMAPAYGGPPPPSLIAPDPNIRNE